MSRLPLSSYDKIHDGSRGFVIGGGPSLLDLTSEQIHALEEEVTVGANKAYKIFTPTYLCWVDGDFYRRFHGEFLNLPCIKFGKAGRIGFDYEIIYGIECDRVRYHRGDFTCTPHSITGKVSFPNSGAFALILSHLLGCNPIYLVGIDLKKDGELTHFHSDYEKKRSNDLVISGVYGRMGNAFRAIIKTLAERGVQVYTTTPGTALEGTIPYVDLRSVLL